VPLSKYHLHKHLMGVAKVIAPASSKDANCVIWCIVIFQWNGLSQAWFKNVKILSYQCGCVILITNIVKILQSQVVMMHVHP